MAWRRQAITWTNDDYFIDAYMRHSASNLNETNKMDSIYDVQHSVMKTCLSKCIHVLNNWYKKLKPNRKETLQKFWLHSVELSRSIITFIVADKMI